MLEHTLRTYQSPTRLVQRLGAIRELGNEASLLGIRRPLLVTDPGVKAAGLLDTALEALRGSDVEPVVFDRVRANPGVELVDAGAAEYRAQGCDGLVAIGGGSSMDTAKRIGVVAVHDGSIGDYGLGHNPDRRRRARDEPDGGRRARRAPRCADRAAAWSSHGVQLRGRAGAVRAHGRRVRNRHPRRFDLGGSRDGGRLRAPAGG